MASGEQCVSLNLHKGLLKDALKQLYALKSTLAELKKFKNEFKTINSGTERSTFLNFATKLRNYIDSIKVEIENVHCTYLVNLETLKRNVENERLGDSERNNGKQTELTNSSSLTSKSDIEIEKTHNSATEKSDNEQSGKCSRDGSRNSSPVRNDFDSDVRNQSDSDTEIEHPEKPLSIENTTVVDPPKETTVTSEVHGEKINQIDKSNEDVSSTIETLYPQYFSPTAFIRLELIDVSSYKIVTDFSPEVSHEFCNEHDSDYDNKKITAQRFFKKLELTDKSSITGSDSDDKKIKRKTRSERNKIRSKNYAESSDSDNGKGRRKTKISEMIVIDSSDESDSDIPRNSTKGSSSDESRSSDTETVKKIENRESVIKCSENLNSTENENNCSSLSDEQKEEDKITDTTLEAMKEVEKNTDDQFVQRPNPSKDQTENSDDSDTRKQRKSHKKDREKKSDSKSREFIDSDASEDKSHPNISDISDNEFNSKNESREKELNDKLDNESDSEELKENINNLIENLDNETNESTKLKDKLDEFVDNIDDKIKKVMENDNEISVEKDEYTKRKKNSDSEEDSKEKKKLKASEDVEEKIGEKSDDEERRKSKGSDNNDSDSSSDKKSGDENKENLDSKRPFLKCIDINKLLDPNIVKREDTENENPKEKEKNKSVIVLSSSDDEKTNAKKESKQLLKLLKKNSNVKVVNVSKVVRVSSDESEVEILPTRTRGAAKKKDSPLKDKFKSLRQKRSARLKQLSMKEISSGSSSSSDNEEIKNKNDKETKNKNDKEIKDKNDEVLHQISLSSDSDSKNKKEKREKIDPNYDHRTDVKFKAHCYIPLPRRTPEEMLKNYVDDLEYRNIKRLTDMKSLKRNRRPGADSDGSSSTTKQKTKRDKKCNKKTETNDETSDVSMNLDESESATDNIIELSGIIEDIVPPITNGDITPDLFSDDETQEEKISESEGKETDDEKKKEKKKPKEKKEDKVEENGDDNENGVEEKNDKEDDKNGSIDSADEDAKKKKEKGKWRNDKLLRMKITETDSEEELIRFKNKKKKNEDEKKSESDNDKSDAEVINKKSLTPKKGKRNKRQLGSESDNSSASDKSSGDLFVKKKNSKVSSDSDSEPDPEPEKKKKVRKRIKRMKASDDSSDDAPEKQNKKKEEEEEAADEPSTRKKIRNVWNRDSLADTTKAAAKEEEERKKRIADRQKLYNQMFDNSVEKNAKVDKLILDFDDETKEELLSVDSALVSKLKPHQASGIRFMWTACFESLERTKKTEGSGCILAHCMGLGKTLQVISLIHTLILNAEETGIKTVLVVCPLSTVLNWVAEFKKWLDDIDGEQVNVFDLVSYKQPRERLFQVQDWQKYGGVLVIGYDMFRNLSNSKGKRMSKKLVSGYNTCLVDPGPDMVICDEGHLLKNEKTGISIAMNRLRTKRRIVLTGTPLQNNLKEYYCMVQFVKPNLLGTYKEYLNRFVNPITNGQYTDSTDRDIHIMRRRSHVLHKMLDGVVERRDYCVLAPFLPPKHEFVLFVTLTPIQNALYKEYLDKYARNNDSKGMSYLFQDFQEFQRICIHPRVLLDKSVQDRLRKDKEDDDSEGSLRDFIDDNDESDKTSTPNETSDDDSDNSTSVKQVSRRKTRANPGNVEEEEEPEPEVVESDSWWQKFIQSDELDNIKHSSKILLLFEVLHQCEMIGDKVLVFSQSLFSLNLIEYFLAKIDEATQNSEKSELLGGYQGSWSLGLDYFRLDGSTPCDRRAAWCKSFNNETNTRARLFLISTRAGGLGINLVAANRVIIFDVSWNPSHDIQSIYRVYRFGQTKPVYIYRFVTLGTMENKVYERQVTKQAISKRVIDEQQIDRHYNQNDLAELYAFTGEPDEERPTPMVPKDRLFADLLQSHEKNIFKYHEHNSLLENKEDETLNEEERKAAWEEFENEKKNIPRFDLYSTMMNNGMIETLRSILQKDNTYAQYTPLQLNNLIPNVVNMINQQVSLGDFSMYHRILEEHRRRLTEQKQMELQYQQIMQQINSGYANPGILQQFFKNHPLQSYLGRQQGVQGTSGAVFNPFASANPAAQQNNSQPPTVSNEIVEIDD